MGRLVRAVRGGGGLVETTFLVWEFKLPLVLAELAAAIFPEGGVVSNPFSRGGTLLQFRTPTAEQGTTLKRKKVP